MFDTRLLLLLAAAIGAALLAFFLLPQGQSQPSGTESTIEVDLTEWSLGFQTLTVPANEEITFVVRNAGTLAHGFEIEGEVNGQEREWVVEPFQPDQTKRLTVTLPPGEYEVYCPVSGHPEAGMEGILIAEPQ